MRRKIVQHGPSTFTVSLPKEWIDRYNLSKGDEVELTPDKTTVHVTALHRGEGEEHTIDLEKTERTIKKIITAEYKLGTDRIKIYYHNQKQLQKIRSTVNQSLPGFEIIEEKKKHVNIRNVADISESNFSQLLRRLFLSTLMTAESINKSKDRKLSEEEKATFLQEERLINRISNYCRRTVNKGLDVKEESTHLLYYIIEHLEKIGDIIANITSERINTNDKASTAEQRSIERMTHNLREFYEMFYEFTLTKYEIYRINLKQNLIFAQGEATHENSRLIMHEYTLLHLIHSTSGVLLMHHLSKNQVLANMSRKTETGYSSLHERDSN
ncbi:MAG: AbrB/MazE/SpoVT family DNA-binding domain-containing protein [Nanobdellota archaeon]